MSLRPKLPPARMMPVLMLIAASGVSACSGNAGLNPATWFGGGEEPDRLITLAAEAEDPRPLVERITEAVVDDTEGSVIVRVVGLPPTQGWYAAELVPRPLQDDGHLVLEFRAVPPPGGGAQGRPESRQLTAAFAITDFGLREISRITVRGETNERTLRP